MDINFRIGHGYDVHVLREGLPFVVAGVEITHEKGCVAHSDGDVAAHALCDALLGAAALGDIGLHFPDTSPEWKGADSLKLLSSVAAMLTDRGYHIGNVDVTLLLQRPKVRPYIHTMRLRLAEAMGISIDKVSVKATTEEGLGFTGSEDGIAAHAVVLIG